jgi:tyrosine-specific transport protein
MNSTNLGSNMKLLGGILLIIGTSIGGGMLALPIATSPIGFVQSSFLLFFCWFVMTAGAFIILEVNLWLPNESNIISMAKATLGKSGQAVAWVTCLLLLYSLLAAYIAGGSDFFKSLLTLAHVSLPSWLVSILFTVLLGQIVFRGIQSVDIVNRGLMFAKLAALFLLIVWVSPHVSMDKLESGEFKYITTSLTVAITSFGFATIIPSLRSYFHNDVKKLRQAILIGSLIPLVCYILWNLTIMGVIPREGENGLISILHSGRSTSEFVNQLSLLLQRDTITTFARIFTSICLLTSFLGVALGLSDFLADGLKIVKEGKNKFLICAVTFLPPLLIVLVYPGAFIAALSYAGIYCVVLLVLLPALMAWAGRYRKNIANGYQVIGGKALLVFLIAVSVGVIFNSILNCL